MTANLATMEGVEAAVGAVTVLPNRPTRAAGVEAAAAAKEAVSSVD